MKLRVIKDFNGLTVGDELLYREGYDQYELTKEDSTITENSTTSKKLVVRISDYIVRYLIGSYLEYIDEDNTPVELKQITFNEMPKEIQDRECPVCTSERDSITYLEDEITKLKKENEELRHALLYDAYIKDIIK